MTYPSNLRLRVLYTINSSPQYILARSRSAVPVNLIQESLLDAKQRSARPKYATVSLKACLDTICRSSPELVQDNNRDYSVYVLDPLESNSVPAPMNISNSSVNTTSTRSQDRKPEEPCGVAVGLGLMSWALHASENESAFVTGTQVQLSTGQEALEVIFALRETAAMQRASLSTALQSWGLPMGMSSPKMQPAISTSSATVNPRALSLTDLSMKQHECASTDDTTPVASHLQLTDSHRKPKNLTLSQPRNKAKSKPKKVSKPSTTPTTQSDKLMYASETYIGPLKKKGRPKNSTTTVEISKSLLAGNKGTVSSLGVEPVVRNLPPSSSVMEDTLATDISTEDAHNRNSLIDLLAVLSNINSPSAQNAGLLAVLNMIDSSTTVQPTTTDQEPSPALIDALRQLLSACASQPSQNAGIQPSASVHPSHASVLNQDEDVIILDKENVDPLAFRRRGDKDATDPKGDNVTQGTNPPTESGNHIYNVLGQRNEQMNSTTMRRKRTLSDFMDERESERNKQRERERSERRELNRQTRKLSSSSSTHDGNSNGLRHYPRLVIEALPRPGMNSYYRVPLETRSSPPRPRVDADINFHAIDCSLSRRTDTMLSASSPSRSNSTVKLRKRYIVPEWARTNTTMQPRLSEDAQQALAEAEEKKKNEREASRRKSSLGYRRLKQEPRSDLKAKSTLAQPSPKTDLPPPVAANNPCPVFAGSDASDDVFSSSSQSIARPASPQSSSSTAPIPQTPPQKRFTPLFTPDENSSSLFTPTPSTRHTRHPEYSPSPSTRSKLFNISPIQAVVSGRSIGGADGWSGKTAEHGWDVDGPPSSLPTASDGEDTPTSRTLDIGAQVTNLQAGIEEQEHCVRQHWVGLPPSSPPPSSPALTPQDQDDEDMELTDLPVPTSDIEGCTTPTFQVQPESDGDGEIARDVFDPPLPALSSDGPMPTDLDNFAQLYDFRSQNENRAPTLESSLESIFQNGLVDFDFTEFWESFKPMVQDHSSTSDSNKIDSSKHVDHMGLAEDMQSLFGGCLM
ncbi:hypothetical protein APHAL10511_003658 [Amanita phalloides]|nr:hypothetical protein APHAL10511_003658 [Amanita phalloides]